MIFIWITMIVLLNLTIKMKNTIFDEYVFASGELEKIIHAYNQLKFKFGELGVSIERHVNLETASHEITTLTIDEFEYRPLPTFNGILLKNSSEFVTFKPRMFYNINSNGELCDVELISIDAVVELDDDKRLSMLLNKYGLSSEEYQASYQDYCDMMRSAMY